MASGEQLMRTVCVFCGSRAGGPPAYAEATRELGRALAARGLGVVYGAGNVGLMGVLADEVLAAGGSIVGVIPHSLVARELAHPRLTELHVVETMHQRKALMADRSDAFLALPGGYGTADEMFEILTWAQLGIHAKPVGMLNVGGFFSPLLAWLDRAVEDGFLRAKHRELLVVADRPGALLDALTAYRAGAPVEKWAGKEDR